MSGIATLPPREDGFVRKKMTVQDCRVLVDSGLLEPGKFELIEGEIIYKMAQGRLHIVVITKLIAVLAAIFGIPALQTQAQIGVGERDEYSDPEPDIAVLEGAVTDYAGREPDPATEVLLAVEVANTSLRGDTTTKSRIYARNGIREYWVVSIPDRELIVFRQPHGEVFADIQRYTEHESLCPLAAPSSVVRIADILP